MSLSHPAQSNVETSPIASEFDVEQIRKDFPILQEKVHGKPLVYLDSGASAQKPQVMIDALVNFYQHDYANIHRGVHVLSERATRAYEDARGVVQRFLNAKEEREIVFVRGTTEAINLVASTYGRDNIKEGDEIIVSAMEHHANIVPWQMLCEQVGAKLRVIPMDDRGVLDMDAYRSMLGPRTKMVAVVHLSNALGTLNPVEEMIELAHQHDVPVLLDGAQSAPHIKVDVQALDCDFFTLSGHKLYGPTGIGVLYGKAALLEKMSPYQGGGDMIEDVTFEKTTFAEIPSRFEAGTPHIAGAVGLAAAIKYVEGIGMEKIHAYTHALMEYGAQRLLEVPGLRLIGTAPNKTSILAFSVQDIHPHDLGTILDQEGVAIRTGHHCAQPVMQHFGVSATARASLSFYNTREEIDTLVAALQKAVRIFSM
ncbi:MAG: cysteine desulfurase [Myxococcales bacterium]|nr:cysteine desulfurase [Myxococcales bacterium]